MTRIIPFCLFLFLAVPLSAYAPTAGRQRTPAKARTSGPFDPTRDAARDLDRAIAQAKSSGKRVLVDVGGNWCSWCHEMERFIEAHPDLEALRDRYFVTVKVNWSPENQNTAVLSKFPRIPAYPHLFVLDSDGRLLQSQDTSKIEDGKSSYDLAKFTAFFEKWGPTT